MLSLCFGAVCPLCGAKLRGNIRLQTPEQRSTDLGALLRPHINAAHADVPTDVQLRRYREATTQGAGGLMWRINVGDEHPRKTRM